MKRLFSSSSSLPCNKLFAWGSGELGKEFSKSLANSVNKTYVPIEIENPSSHRILSIAAGHNHSLISNSLGEVYAFGNNNYGCLGHADFSTTKGDNRHATPLKVPGLSDISQVSCGHGLSAALSQDGKLYTWGFLKSFFFGLGALGRKPPTADASFDFHPQRVFVGGEENDVKLKQISCGAQHMMGLGLDGEVWIWGKGSQGLLGNGQNSDQLLPLPLMYFLDTNTEISQIACGSDFNLALDTEGRVYSWGGNTRGQLGLGGGFSMDLENMPRQIEYFAKENIVIRHISAGNCHACAVTDQGEVYTWGYSAWTEPHLISSKTLLENKRVIKTSSGRNFSAAITQEGEMFTWGKNYFTQRLGSLGTGSDHPTNKRQPQQIPDLHFREVSCGDTHVLALGQ